MKRKILTSLSILMIAVFVAGGTMAYLMASASDVNSMQNGQLRIKQHEYQRVTEDNETTLEAFQQEQKILPGVYEEEALDKKVPVTIDGNAYQFWGDVENAIDKIVTAENLDIGNGVSAYVRTVFAFPVFSDGTTKLHCNFHNPDDQNAIKIMDQLIEIGGQKYQVWIYNYKNPIAAGATTEPSLLEVVFDEAVTSENLAELNGKYEILVASQAVQQSGFSDVLAAFGVAFPEITSENHPWVEMENQEVVVTATNVADMDFTQDNVTYRLTGNFTEDVNIETVSGVTQTFDATGATFEGEVLINAPGVAHSYSSLNAEREGTINVTGFDVATLNVNAYNNEAVNITNNNVNAMSIVGGNFALNISGNTIDGNFGKYVDGEGQTNEYGISMRITDYELSVENNVITDTYSHAIGINGRQGEAASDWGTCGANNKIVKFTGNKITVNSTEKTERAALKIWCDQVYAPYATSGQEPTAAAKALMDTILADSTNVFTLGAGHTTFNIFDYTK